MILFEVFVRKLLRNSDCFKVLGYPSRIKPFLSLNLIFSSVLTPFALNKSRQLLGQDKLNSFLPTIRAQQFSDSFKGFTFIVEKKINNEIKKIFLHDTVKNLKN